MKKYLLDVLTLRLTMASGHQLRNLFGVKQKRRPDWGLNPGLSRHIPDALTAELSVIV